MIIKNIDKLLLFQENLEDRIEDMNSSRSNLNNKTFINVIKSFFNIFITTCLIYAYMLTFSFNQNFIREIAKKLLNISIYPTKADFLNVTEEYLLKEHPRYFESFSQKQWDIFYSENIYKDVSINDLHSF